MRIIVPTSLAAVAAVWLAAATPARAGCTLDQIDALLGSGFSHEQVTQICAGLRPPDSGATAGDAPRGDAAQPRPDATATPPFASDVLTPEIGDDGTWKKYLHDGDYVLQNKADPGAGFILLAQKGDGNWTSFGASVRFTHEKVDEGGVVGAALAYESGAPGGEIILYSLRVDGTVAVTRNSGSELVPIASRQDPAFAVPDWRFVALGVRRHGATTEFLVDGKSTGLEAPCAEHGGGTYGIAVFGIGSYEFRDFQHQSK
jgi:hypothetical protein